MIKRWFLLVLRFYLTIFPDSYLYLNACSVHLREYLMISPIHAHIDCAETIWQREDFYIIESLNIDQSVIITKPTMVWAGCYQTTKDYANKVKSLFGDAK